MSLLVLWFGLVMAWAGLAKAPAAARVGDWWELGWSLAMVPAGLLVAWAAARHPF